MQPLFFLSHYSVLTAQLEVKEDNETYRFGKKMFIQNPHDKFFKETFGDVMIAKDFLAHYLPMPLRQATELKSLEPQKDSFVNKELNENFSDLLFKAAIHGQEGYYYFLFEHKSYPDKRVVLQLFKYMYEIWNRKANKEHNWELPIIIPLVIYHGKENWMIPRNLGDMIHGYHHLPNELKRHIPQYEYIFYDLSSYSDKDIKGGLQLKMYLTILRDILTDDVHQFLDSIDRALDYLLDIEEQEKRMVYLKTLMTYIFNAGKNLTRNEVKQIVDKIPEGSDVIMTLAERYREEGEKRGFEKGIESGKIEVTKNLIKKGFSLKEILEITGLDKEEVEKIQRNML